MSNDINYYSLYEKNRLWIKVALILIFVMILTIAYDLLQKNENKIREESESNLTFVLNSTHDIINIFSNKVINDANLWASDKIVVESTEKILSQNTKIDLIQQELHKYFNVPLRNYNYLGYFIISPNYINLATSHDENIGKVNLIAKSYENRLQKVFLGDSQFIPPIFSEIPLKNYAGELVDNYPTMFVLVPIMNKNKKIIAALAIRFSPLESFSTIIKTGEIGKSGETYLFSKDGRLLTESRFDDQLREIGLLNKDEFSMLNIDIRDPLVNLTTGRKTNIERKKQPLTNMLLEALLGTSGSTKNANRDYRGVSTLYSWLWDNNLDIGFCTQIDESEALQPYYNYRFIIFIFLGITLLIVIVLLTVINLSHRNGERLLKENKEYYSTVLNKASIGIITIEDESIIKTFNSQAELIWGYSKNDIIGKNFSVLFQEFFSEYFPHDYFNENNHDNNSFKKETFGIRNDDTIFPINLTLSKIKLNDSYTYIAIIEDIAERKKAENALANSESLFRNTFDNAPIGIANLSSKGKILNANPYFCSLLGYSRDEILYFYLHDISHPKDRIKSLNNIAALFSEQKTSISIEKRYFNKKREIIWCNETVSIKKNDKNEIENLIVIIEDISIRKEFEDKLKKQKEDIEKSNIELKKSRKVALSIMQDANQQKSKTEQALVDLEKSTLEYKKLSQAIEQASVTVIITDTNGKIEYVNPHFTEVTGYLANEAIGNNPKILKSGNMPTEFYENLWEVLKSKNIWQGEFENKKKNGETYWVSSSISPVFNFKGEITHFVAVNEDITERRIKDAELREAKAVAEAATEAKSHFLASMSHEIRTPMNAIIGFSHLALRTKLNPKQFDYLNKIELSANSLLGIINDILDFSKLEANKLKIESIDFNLEGVITFSTNLVMQKIFEKGLELIVSIAPDVPLNMIGDPLRLGQIITNFCNNAVKFTEVGEIVIRVSVIKQDSENAELLFSVQDTGVGIKNSQKDRLFKAFEQADTSTTRKFGGTGLGLVISENLVKLMNGKIWFESTENIGSTFYFSIILQKQENQPINKIQFLGNELKDMKILLYKTNSTTIRLFKESLKQFSFEFETASSKQNALDILNKVGNNYFNLIVSDYKYFETDTADTLKLIKNKYNVPILIIVSTFLQEQIKESQINEITNTFLIKPFNNSDLFNSILELFGKKFKRENALIDMQDKFKKEFSNVKDTLILLAEDNKINQQVIVEILAEFGIRVEIANNGLEAYEMVGFSGSPSKYSLVLMDIQMPIMDGFAATTKIRKLKDYKYLPIIAMTADATTDVKEKSIQIGMSDYLTKPIEPNKLLESLSSWILPLQDFSNKSVSGISKYETQLETIELPDIYGINIDDGLRFASGDRNLLLKLLKKFLDNAAFEKKINDAITQDDRKILIRLIHTLKGNSALLGMNELAKITEKTQTILMQDEIENESENIQYLITEIINELNPIIDSLKSFFITEVEILSENKKYAEVEEELNEIKALLETHDLEAINLINNFSSILGFEAEVKELKTSVNNYQFDKGLQILSKINGTN